MSAHADLAGVLAGSGAILLDFDGPVCSIFSGCPAPQVAAELADLLRSKSVDLPAAIAGESDPLEVLRWTGTIGDPALTVAVEGALCAAEIRAAGTAEPTPYGREVIVAAGQAGLPVAIVSNNSADAVTAYLVAHRLAGHVALIVGRVHADPARMKPNPQPILRAARFLGAEPAQCVLIGDSLSDIEGARAAGVRIIGYANKAPKVERFRRAGADAVVTSMGEIASGLVERAPA